MNLFDAIITKLPGVAEPKTHLNFKTRLKWTASILILYLVMGQISLYGIEPSALTRFKFIELILGSSFGTLITLGIGPIVTASIILQLLVGSKIIPWDLQSAEGRKRFQGTQKLLAILFAIFEAFAFVKFGAIRPASPEFLGILVAQVALGAIIILMMDEVISKWGIGSGVSLFIAAGVTKTIFIRAFNPLVPAGQQVPAGLLPQFAVLLSMGELFQAMVALLPVIATVLVFAMIVYIQSIKVEIPLAFTSIRGFSRRWPLNLIYTSNIPVILIAALIANLQLMGSMMAVPTESGKCGLLGCFDEQGTPISGLVYYLQQPNTFQQDLSLQIFFLVLISIVFVTALLAFYFRKNVKLKMLLGVGVIAFILAMLITYNVTGLPTLDQVTRSLIYTIVLVAGAAVFSVFWVSTSGMDAHSIAEQIEGLGMQLPGFRRDPRIVEQVLNRYIPQLAILSGIFIGLLAALADFTGALGTGTGILLTVMIVYNLYENIATRYVEDMHPSLRKFFE